MSKDILHTPPTDLISPIWHFNPTVSAICQHLWRWKWWELQKCPVLFRCTPHFVMSRWNHMNDIDVSSLWGWTQAHKLDRITNLCGYACHFQYSVYNSLISAYSEFLMHTQPCFEIISYQNPCLIPPTSDLLRWQHIVTSLKATLGCTSKLCFHLHLALLQHTQTAELTWFSWHRYE